MCGFRYLLAVSLFCLEDDVHVYWGCVCVCVCVGVSIVLVVLEGLFICWRSLFVGVYVTIMNHLITTL